MFDLIHPYPVLLATVLLFIIGSLWYSPLMFGPAWMRALGRDPKKTKGAGFPATKMSLEFINAFITSFVLALFAIPLSTPMAAIIVALIIWVGFYVTLLLSEVLWEDKPFNLFLINASLRLINCVVALLVLSIWK